MRNLEKLYKVPEEVKFFNLRTRC